MEVCTTVSNQPGHHRLTTNTDIHSRNVLVKLPTSFDNLSIQEFYEKFGEPETVPVTRVDGMPLTPNVPPQVVLHLNLGKEAKDFTLEDARALILSDFGEAFFPAKEQRLGRDCNTPVRNRAPEAFFELNERVTYSFDIWSLALAIWEIVGMKPLFSDDGDANVLIRQEIDTLGAYNFPEHWRNRFERPGEDDSWEHGTIPRRQNREMEKWPSFEEAFEAFVQKYRREWRAAEVFEEEETRAILELMRGMLKFRPEERMSIDEVLKSEWMVKWALPQLRQC